MRERERLWYVACTRARELLIVPELPQAEQRSWAQVIDMAQHSLPDLDLSHVTPAPAPINTDPANIRTAELFDAERDAIAAAAIPLTWIRPSGHEPDRILMIEAVRDRSSRRGRGACATVGAGRVRGVLVHKLMEEVLTGELVEDVGLFAARTRELLTELVPGSTERGELPDADEIAAVAWRTLQLPDIAALRPRLVPEWPIYALITDRPGPSALAGRFDAIAYDGERVEVVVDWKSNSPRRSGHPSSCRPARSLSSRVRRSPRRIGLHDRRPGPLGDARTPRVSRRWNLSD